MALYVDHMRIPFRRMLMNHLMADTPEELEQARVALGLPENARHNAGLAGEHLDVSESKRNQAVRELGAAEVSPKYMVQIIRSRRENRQQQQNSAE